MKQTGLRFLFQYGAFLDLVLTADHARQILDKFKELARQPKRSQEGTVIEGIDLQNISYALSADYLLAVHTVPLQQAKPQLGTQTNRSGIV